MEEARAFLIAEGDEIIAEHEADGCVHKTRQKSRMPLGKKGGGERQRRGGCVSAPWRGACTCTHAAALATL